MIAKSGSSLIFYAHYTNSGSSATGLTVTIDVWEVQRDGTAAEIVTAGAATEIGDGLYRYILVSGSVDAAAEYVAVFKTAGTCDQAHLPAMWTVDRDVPVGAVASVTGAVGSVAAGGITGGSFATGAIDADALAADAVAEIADTVLRRTMANVEASSYGDTLSVESLYGLLAVSFEAALASTTLTIRKSDGSTLGTKTLTIDAAADPVTGIT